MELDADEFDFLGRDWHGQDWAVFLDQLERHRRGEDLSADCVPETFLVAEDDDGELVGRASVRHALTDALAHIGGHVGYGVRPPHRGRGHGTALLRAGLGVPAKPTSGARC